MTENWMLARNADDDRACSPRKAWRKSSFSESNGDCVEVSSFYQINVRDTKAPAGPHIRFSSDAWITFIGNLRESRSNSGD